MNAILRQAIANLRSHRLQSVLIVLTLFAAASLLAVALSALQTAQGAYDRLFQRTEGAHLWFELDPAKVTGEQAVNLLKDLPGVESTTPAMRTLSGTLFMGDDRVGGLLFREWPGDTLRAGQSLLVSGRAPEEGEKDVIVLDRNEASYHGVETGDTVDILTPAGRVPLRVIGLFVSAEFCPYGNCFPARNYLAVGALADLGLLSSDRPGDGSWDIGLRLGDPSDLDSVLSVAQTSLPQGSIVDWSSWESIRRAADSSVSNWRILLLTFSGVAAISAGLLIANAIGGAVRSQTRQIGLLKAVGFTGGQVGLIYLSQSLVLALGASLAGLLAGMFLASVILSPVAAMFGEKFAMSALWIVAIPPLGTLAVAAASTLLPVRNALRLSIVEAIRAGAEKPRRGGRQLLRLPASLALGLNDLFCRPRRTVLAACGLALAMVTLTSALILYDTFQALVSDPGLSGFDEDIYVYRVPFLDEGEMRQVVNAQPQVMGIYAECWANFHFVGEDEVLYARFREGDIDTFRFPIVEGRMFASSGEVVVGYGLARERDLQPGDVMSIVIEGKTVEVRVVGLYRESSNLGRMLMMSLDTLREVKPEVEVYKLAIKLGEGADAHQVADEIVLASNHFLSAEASFAEGLPEDLRMAQWMMAGLSLLMAGIGLLGVLSGQWMSVQERQREMGMLKAVGMTPRQVAWSVLLGAAAVGLLGYAIGLPLGVVGIRALIDVVARGVGFGPLNAPANWAWLVLLLPVIVVVALGGAWLPARRAGRVSVVEMLRYE